MQLRNAKRKSPELVTDAKDEKQSSQKKHKRACTENIATSDEKVNVRLAEQALHKELESEFKNFIGKDIPDNCLPEFNLNEVVAHFSLQKDNQANVIQKFTNFFNTIANIICANSLELASFQTKVKYQSRFASYIDIISTLINLTDDQTQKMALAKLCHLVVTQENSFLTLLDHFKLANGGLALAWAHKYIHLLSGKDLQACVLKIETYAPFLPPTLSENVIATLIAVKSFMQKPEEIAGVTERIFSQLASKDIKIKSIILNFFQKEENKALLSDPEKVELENKQKSHREEFDRILNSANIFENSVETIMGYYINATEAQCTRLIDTLYKTFQKEKIIPNSTLLIKLKKLAEAIALPIPKLTEILSHQKAKTPDAKQFKTPDAKQLIQATNEFQQNPQTQLSSATLFYKTYRAQLLQDAIATAPDPIFGIIQQYDDICPAISTKNFK